MKKQFLVLAAIFTTVAFISCSKENISAEQSTNSDEVATAAVRQERNGSVSTGPVRSLEGLYEFNGNLKEKTGKLADGIPTIASVVGYTKDRNGFPNKAILFSGRYGVKIPGVPCQSSMSVAVWIRYGNVNSPLQHVVNSASAGPTLSHETNKYLGIISTPATTSVVSPPMDNKWHHLVATYDANELKFYVDGNYVGNSINPITPWGGSAFPYYLAYYPSVNLMWQGALDDLRFYSRTLTASEVQAIYNL
jgi:hypothetical protein